ncbi:YycC family protein [Paenibacillus sp. MER TA 81-3]|uniref:YycC family protein n=1 Tax=Paenibacillus sp. MER TA 81-3 TaxID=2939573 RepID=UPI00203C2605|nr:YycC family protein [Paenibacillus sp. MER TA 81-3]MCM3338885.1 YycC family protein [Paenibacillus sp. MER TA 81-3]
MRPLQISADTALKLSKALGVPMEQLMHMPQHILLKKLAELAQPEAESSAAADNHASTENPK